MRFIIIAIVATLSLAAPDVNREDGKPGEPFMNGKTLNCQSGMYIYDGTTFCGEDAEKMSKCMDHKKEMVVKENKCKGIKKKMKKDHHDKAFGSDARKDKRFNECQKETGAKPV